MTLPYSFLSPRLTCLSQIARPGNLARHQYLHATYSTTLRGGIGFGMGPTQMVLIDPPSCHALGEG